MGDEPQKRVILGDKILDSESARLAYDGFPVEGPLHVNYFQAAVDLIRATELSGGDVATAVRTALLNLNREFNTVNNLLYLCLKEVAIGK